MLSKRAIRLLSCCALGAGLLSFIYLTRPDQPRLFLTRLNQVSVGVEQRITWWDWQDTQEEVVCRGQGRTNGTSADHIDPIPNTVHYVLLGDKGQPAEMTYRNFLSMKATLLRIRPSEIKVHTYGLNATNSWWQLIEKSVTLVEHDRRALKGPHGRPVDDFHIAHQSDFLRLDILHREGGIYLDTDVFALKSFEELLAGPRDIVMGHEGGNRYGLYNAVIIARAKSEFLQKWIASYTTFQRWVWNYHSVRIPKLLQVQYPELICPLSPSVFFWPTWAGPHERFMQDPIGQEAVEELRNKMSAHGGAMYENQLALHHSARDLTPERILQEDTRFNILMRDIVDAPLP